MTPALRLFSGITSHVRFTPFRRAFRYKVTMISVDVDRLSAADSQTRFFSVDRFNLLSLKTTRHGSLGETTLASWARKLFEENNISGQGCRIRLVTFPHLLGYAFSPLSLWICEDRDGSPKGLIYEVNNTFGERHSYVAPMSDGQNVSLTDKMFHVSPFFDISGQYRFSGTTSCDDLRVLIENICDGERQHSAVLNLVAKPATSFSLLKFVASTPFSAIGVTLAIHWQAFWLWAKGAKYHSKPAPPIAEYTSAYSSKLIIKTKKEEPA